MISDFLYNNYNFETVVRVVNYLYGWWAPVKDDKILIFMDHIKIVYNHENEIYNLKEELNKYAFKEIKSLYKDLKLRNKKWLSSGYYHQHQNQLMLDILEYLGEEDWDLKELQLYGKINKNNYNFLF